MRQFEEGEESNRFDKDQVQLGGFLKRSFGPHYQKTNLKFNLNYKKIDYSPLGSETTSPPPPDQANLTPTVGLSTGKTEWVQNKYIDKMGITEDDWLGHRYGGKVGYGIPLEDSLELWDVRVFVVKNMALPRKQLLYLNASVNSEVVRNTFVRFSAK